VRPNSPSSWNRYAYALGDPINGNDPQGLEDYSTVSVRRTPVVSRDLLPSEPV